MSKVVITSIQVTAGVRSVWEGFYDNAATTSEILESLADYSISLDPEDTCFQATAEILREAAAKIGKLG